MNQKKKEIPIKFFELQKKQKKFDLITKKGILNKVLKKNEVLVKNLYSSINYRDHLAFKGNHAIARKYPYIPGVDFVGYVIDSNDKKFLKGQRVGAFSIPNNQASPGAWSSHLKINTKFLFKLKSDWSYQDVITIGTAGLAAASGINLIKKNVDHKKKALSIVITGASGGVGSIACLIAKSLNWKITVVSRLPKKFNSFFKFLGVDKVIDKDDFISKSQMSILPQEFDCAIDCVGGKYLTNTLKRLKNNGVCSLSGMIDGRNLEDLTVIPFLIRGISLMGTGSEVLNKTKKNNSFKIINDLITSGKLKENKKNNQS